jgi:hypothetical protein
MLSNVPEQVAAAVWYRTYRKFGQQKQLLYKKEDILWFMQYSAGLNGVEIVEGFHLGYLSKKSYLICALRTTQIRVIRRN